MTNINDIKQHQVSSSDSYFFDNNIWMFIYGSIGNSNDRKQKVYSTLLADIQSAKAMIFTTSMVMSEFSNACLRLGFKLWKEKQKKYDADFKRDYIPTDDYKANASNIKICIEDILKMSQRLPDDYNAINMNAILSQLENVDFNDCYYAELCAKQGLKLVTDDKDFQKIICNNLYVISMI